MGDYRFFLIGRAFMRRVCLSGPESLDVFCVHLANVIHSWEFQESSSACIRHTCSNTAAP